MSDTDAPRKAPRRWWLLAPYIALGVALGFASLYWLWARSTFDTELHKRADTLRRAGYTLEINDMSFGGWPSRLEVKLDSVRIRAPSGWGLTARDLTAGALLYDLGHWVVADSRGLTVTRPEGGDIDIAGDAIRASLAGFDAPTPRIAIEGVNLKFHPAAGARPFSLAEAARLELYTRPSTDGTSAEALLRFDGVSLAPGTILTTLASSHRLSGAFALRLTRFGAWKGHDWTSSGRAWAKAGGRVEFDPTAAPSADLAVICDRGALTFGEDGRPDGELPLAFVFPKAERISAHLSFDDGVTRLGPVRLGPAPRLF